MADRLLLRGGAVVSMDPDVGNLPKGDILIEGDKIVQIAANIQRRLESAADVDFGVFRKYREVLGHETHLDIVRQAQRLLHLLRTDVDLDQPGPL